MNPSFMATSTNVPRNSFHQEADAINEDLLLSNYVDNLPQVSRIKIPNQGNKDLFYVKDYEEVDSCFNACFSYYNKKFCDAAPDQEEKVVDEFMRALGNPK